MPRWRRFRGLFGPEPGADVDEELAFHLEMRVQELVGRGESPERARERTLERFGDYERSRQECVDTNRRRVKRMARAEYVGDMAQDVRYAVRLLRRAPGFTAVAVLAVALGIGATTAIFSVVHAVLLRPLPYVDAHALHVVQMVYPDGTRYSSLSAPDFMSVRAEARAFSQVEAMSSSRATLVDAGEAREVLITSVSDGMFDLLGIRTVLGRAFLPDEHQPGQGRVAVVDHGFWQRTFGGEATTVGRVVSAGGNRYEIVGVLAPGHRLPMDAELYVPITYDESFSAMAVEGRRSEYLDVIARATPGATGEQIAADLARVGTQLQTAFPSTNGSLTFGATSLTETVVGDVRTPLFILLGAVGFVLLIACANVANMLLARASTRQAELGVRVAIGASHGRIVRQLITEAVVLGLVGAAVGLGLAHVGTRVLVAAQPADIPRLADVAVDGTVILVGLLCALVTSVAFGTLPAWQVTRGGLMTALREGSRSGGGSAAAHRARATLVVAEMALAVVLLMGAGLLVRSFVELTRVDPGFRTEGAISFRFTLQGEDYQRGDDLRGRVGQISERLRALPGVQAAAATSVLPLSGLSAIINFDVEGAPPPPPEVNREIGIASITPDYFRAIGAPLKHGRAFTEWDRSDAPPVAIINEAGARRWFPGQDPVGQRVEVDTTREIVGVVADVRQRSLGAASAPQLFVPYDQRSTRAVRMVVHAVGDPLTLVPAIRRELQALDPDLPLTGVARLDELVRTSLARPRFYTSLLALFAALALVLAATGVFGVMSYAVAQRTREIGIRMALGAEPASVLQMIVGRAVLLAGAGLVAGVLVALPLARALETQLFNVSSVDPLTLGLVTLVLGVSAAAASALPARRAVRVDPATALRDD